jgi:AraC-like DNA-binding protein
MGDVVAEHAVAAPAPLLRPYVRRYTGYRYAGLPAGEHRGLPSRDLTVVLAWDDPTRMTALPDPRQPPAALHALLGGLHTRPVLIAHDGHLAGVQLGLTPAGARALFGLPAAELCQAVVPLEAVLGPQAGELLERLAGAGSWGARFAVLDTALARRLGDTAGVAAPLHHAWSLLTASGGAARIATVAGEVGYSRRALDARFTREFGLGPKQLARVVRFERSHRLLKRDAGQPLGRVALAAGYYDQAHMARDWNELAGCPPSRWLAGEGIPFVQDEDAGLEETLAA